MTAQYLIYYSISCITAAESWLIEIFFPTLPPHFLTFELHRSPSEIHVVNAENVIESVLIPDAVFCICHRGNLPAPTHSKIHLTVIHYHPGICIFIGGLAT